MSCLKTAQHRYPDSRCSSCAAGAEERTRARTKVEQFLARHDTSCQGSAGNDGTFTLSRTIYMAEKSTGLNPADLTCIMIERKVNQTSIKNEKQEWSDKSKDMISSANLYKRLHKARQSSSKSYLTIHRLSRSITRSSYSRIDYRIHPTISYQIPTRVYIIAEFIQPSACVVVKNKDRSFSRSIESSEKREAAETAGPDCIIEARRCTILKHRECRPLSRTKLNRKQRISERALHARFM